MDSNHESGSPDVVKLLADCLKAYATGGLDAVQEILEEHPQHADKLRNQIQSLSQLGLLEASEQTPRHFGPYTIRERLGRGGMSEVFLAFDPRMKREVALKCAHPGLALEDRAQKRFQREIEAVAKLSHPGIVPVFDVGLEDGRAFFTMEYAEGETLANLIHDLLNNENAAHKLPRGLLISEAVDTQDPSSHVWQRPYIEQSCRWALELSEALSHAHSAGVIHRDVTPANIIIRQNGSAQLFDFGLAMLLDAPALTNHGEFTGTPYYVSPEQLAGKPGEIDERCDIYSLGVTLYELLTLQRPFEGQSTVEVLNRIQRDNPKSPREHNPNIPRDLELVCLTALERDRNRRYSTMAEFTADLRSFLAFEPVTARPLGKAERGLRFIKQRPAFATALALGAILFIGLPPVLLSMNASMRRERDAAIGATERANESATQATRSAARANHIADEFRTFIVGIFEGDQTGAQGLPLEELVTRGIDRLAQASVQGDEDIELAMLESTGEVFLDIGQYERAEKVLSALVIRKPEQLGTQPADFVRVSMLWARALIALGDQAEAHQALTLANMSAKQSELGPIMFSETHLLLAETHLNQDNHSEAFAHFKEAIKPAQAGIEATPEESIPFLSHLADVATRLGEFELAADARRSCLNAQITLFESDPFPVLAARRELLIALGQYEGIPQRVSELGTPSVQDLEAIIEQTDATIELWKRGELIPEPLIDFDFVNAYPLPDLDALFDSGLRALYAQRLKESREAFTNILLIQPHNAGAAFNSAILETAAGDHDLAFAWLNQAIDNGYGRSLRAHQPLDEVNDFAALVGDPRLQLAMQRIETVMGAPPLTKVLGANRSGPIMVILTETASSPDDALTSRLAAALDEQLHTVIAIKPNAPIGDGNPAWMGTQTLFHQGIELVCQQLMRQVRGNADLESRPRRPMIIFGIGDSGPFATRLAFQYPGLFAGLVLVDSMPGPIKRSAHMQNAAIAGLSITLLDDPEVDFKWVKVGTSQDELNHQVADWFEANAFDVELLQTQPLALSLERILERAGLKK